MTGDRFRQLSHCYEIDALGDVASFIFFGRRDELYGGDFSHFHKLASMDTINNPHEQLNYYYIIDMDCMEEHDLNTKKPAIGLNLHRDI